MTSGPPDPAAPPGPESQVPDFKSGQGSRARVLAVVALVVGAVAAVGIVDAVRRAPFGRKSRGMVVAEDPSLFGCPCGCDRSALLIAELRAQSGAAAASAVDERLTAIAEREDVGYV